MLVLTRRELEMIAIGDDVVVQILKASQGACRIAIHAPKDTNIARREIATGIQKQNCENAAMLSGVK